jgi:tRNA-Thr(GGU) m(6)t(6)A37 methyltransferase TsaA
MTQRQKVILGPIGVIRSPHRSPAGTPIQPAYAAEVNGEVEVDQAYLPALDDIDGFDRIWLVYCLDRAKPWKPRVVPYRDTQERGLFATRAPSRPNPIGISVVRLIGRQDNVLRVRGLDVLDRTPLLDIKPYVPEFDAFPESKAGWLDARRADRREADGRFHQEQEPSEERRQISPCLPRPTTPVWSPWPALSPGPRR